MLCVKTKIGPSEIEGIGLFAAQLIPKGAVVWKYAPELDTLFSIEDINNLSQPTQEQIFRYAFLDKERGKYMLCGDDGRFFNHSEQPNCNDSMPDITLALRDIAPGEELTVDYGTFYGDIEDHPEIRK